MLKFMQDMSAEKSLKHLSFIEVDVEQESTEVILNDGNSLHSFHTASYLSSYNVFYFASSHFTQLRIPSKMHIHPKFGGCMLIRQKSFGMLSLPLSSIN